MQESKRIRPARMSSGLLKAIDIFYERLHLRFPSGEDRFHTFFGIFMSVVYVFTLGILFSIHAIEVGESYREGSGPQNRL